MENIMPFDFQGKEVKVIVKDGEPWFIAKDICEILGLTNNSQAISTLSINQKGITKVDTPGGTQEKSIVNESGLYKLIFKSKKDGALAFQDHVTDTILPTIRKTGSYQIKTLSPAEVMLQQAQMLVDQEKKMLAMAMDIEQIKAKQSTINVDYFTVSGYCSLKKVKLSLSQAKIMGMRASKLAKDLCSDIGKIHDEKYGSVNSYDIAILDAIFIK